MVVVAQLVRALDCGSRGRRFETGLPPRDRKPEKPSITGLTGFFYCPFGMIDGAKQKDSFGVFKFRRFFFLKVYSDPKPFIPIMIVNGEKIMPLFKMENELRIASTLQNFIG